MSTCKQHSENVDKPLRHSNMEALRIIAMSMILIHHFMIHGIKPENIPYNLFHGLNSFVYCGVNIFFLLSGYFTIRYSFKGLLKLVLTILFFGVINMLLLTSVGEMPELKRWIVTLIFPLTNSPYWFISVYLFLYITAPILNAGLNNMSRPSLRNTLIILILTLFYSNSDFGCASYLHGMYIYCIGYYIGKYKPLMNIANGWWLAGFFILTGISSGLDWSFASLGHTIDYFTTYKNIFILLGAVMLLLYFRKLSFNSRIINSIATASLGCYLLQDGFFGYRWLYTFQGKDEA